jgi:hypothetical protein
MDLIDHSRDRRNVLLIPHDVIRQRYIHTYIYTCKHAFMHAYLMDLVDHSRDSRNVLLIPCDVICQRCALILVTLVLDLVHTCMFV